MNNLTEIIKAFEEKFWDGTEYIVMEVDKTQPILRRQAITNDIKSFITTSFTDLIKHLEGELREKDYDPKRGGISDYQAEGYNQAISDLKAKLNNLIK